MQHRLFLLTSIIVWFFFGMLFLSQCNRSEDTVSNQQQPSASRQQAAPELAEYMSRLQYFSHKLALSVEGKNKEAATFYFHEVEELVEAIKEDVPEYEGYDIARLVESFLEPEIAPAEDALADDNWKETRSRLITFVDACNTCHQATDHGFIQITPGFNTNPYNQVFDTR